IRNYCCTLISWIIRGKSLYLRPLGLAWLELARLSHHSLDIVTPPAAFLPIEDYIGYRNLRRRRLTGGLKGNCPDQVVSIVSCQAPSWFRLGCCRLLGHVFRGKQCLTRRRVAPLLSMSQRGKIAGCSMT